jgi:hypothetical protein
MVCFFFKYGTAFVIQKLSYYNKEQVNFLP